MQNQNDTKESNVYKKLLSIKEVCTYLGIGQTIARELIRGHNGFGVRIGNRWYADKNKLYEVRRIGRHSQSPLFYFVPVPFL